MDAATCLDCLIWLAGVNLRGHLPQGDVVWSERKIPARCLASPLRDTSSLVEVVVGWRQLFEADRVVGSGKVQEARRLQRCWGTQMPFEFIRCARADGTSRTIRT